jgi:hypothetical protein
MKEFERIISDIKSSRAEIARAMALSIADGNEEKAREYFQGFYKSICDVDIFVFDEPQNAEKNEYVLELNGLLNDISGFCGVYLNSRFYNPKNDISPVKIDVEDVSSKEEKRLHELYCSSDKMFLRLGITYQDLIYFYKREGIDKAVYLATQVCKLKRKAMFYDFKVYLGKLKAEHKYDMSVNAMKIIVDNYNVDSMDDLFEFYTEVSSFFVDTTNLSYDEIEIISKNRENFMKRTGKRNVSINSIELIILKKSLEDIYNNQKIKEHCLDTSNIKRFFAHFNYEFNRKNLLKFIYLYEDMQSSAGFCEVGKSQKYVYYSLGSIRRHGARGRNDLIIHELIHALERYKNPLQEDAQYKYTALNEALTEYFAKNALKYLRGDIIKDVACEDFFMEEFYSSYDCMLPLVEVLKNSVIWDDLVECKLNNDYSMLENKIGRYSKTISKLFEKVYNMSNNGDSYNIDEEIAELKSILIRIEKVYNSHLKVAI